jgi:peptidoglycan/LPS O-acetylase OafA/YrhL
VTGRALFEPVLGSGRAHFPEVDGARGLAIALVVLFHAVWSDQATLGLLLPNPLAVFITAGNTGVSFFFVLSGFLLGLPWAKGHPPSLSSYYAKRALRILPLYWGVLAAALLVVRPADLSLRGVFPLAAFLVTAPLPRVELGAWTTIFWSLSTEVHFYLLLPLLGRVLTSIPRLALLIPLALAFKAGAWALAPDQMPYFLETILARVDQFAIGMMIARLHAIGRLTLAPRVGLAAIAGTTLLLGCHLWWGLHLSSTSPVCIAWNTVEGALWGTLLASALALPAGWKRVLTSWPLRRLGVVSYSVLLWHAPIAAYLLHAVRPWRVPAFSFHFYAIFPVVLAVSTVSYLVLERPFLLVARRFGRVTPS